MTVSGTMIPSGCPDNAWTSFPERSCLWALEEKITFDKAFSKPPTISVHAVSLWTDFTPCILKFKGPSGYYESGQAMDAQLAFASDVTSTGFNLRGGSSPTNDNKGCRAHVNNYWIPNVLKWVATGLK